MSILKKIKLLKISTEKGKYVKGIWKPGNATFETFLGTWQANSGDLQDTIPEGKRGRNIYICFAPIDMKWTISDPISKELHDYIVFDGRAYEVYKAEKWINILPHWRLICIENKEGDGTALKVYEDIEDKISIKEKLPGFHPDFDITENVNISDELKYTGKVELNIDESIIAKSIQIDVKKHSNQDNIWVSVLKTDEDLEYTIDMQPEYIDIAYTDDNDISFNKTYEVDDDVALCNDDMIDIHIHINYPEIYDRVAVSETLKGR